MMRRVTLAEVARAAGVGAATVSRALAGQSDVSESTRARVRAVAEELGYRPSVAARALRRGGHRAFSVIVPNNQWGWWEPVVRACITAAGEAGYQVLIHPVTDAPGGLASVIDTLVDVPTEGVIVISVPDQRPVRDACDRIGIPAVALDDTSTTIHLPSISASNSAGAQQVTQHLLDLGRRRIAFLAPRPPGGSTTDLLFLRDRIVGYRNGLESAGVPVDPDLIIEADLQESDDRCPELSALLERDPSIDALFCAYDQLAPAAMRVIGRHGLRIPDDIAVAGFDDERAAVLVTPQLTTARQPYQEMGRRAAELLLDGLAGEHAAIARHEFATTLVVRGSTVTPPNPIQV
ncbi:LacI family DNA-binding transcriptional regulator [Rathayibacter sp. VKM Ac-2760]|uniref:LacI family DNA-binding transcriptional regulator n=1 Tax=Rathayibacter sp. VKM Ac-2760 TaxID=2609253 RepID=UPI0013186060|nr:LacI family DNA-binding transcriptional regulator [Rathayibacter sp. VKM Ac-2760]QHC58754.1 substrate-binding domain-containing protein [Rathayibacter sp. VKM Ac-2760]